ncbi:MAG: PHP domain-containing protein [Oscillospiraceae bacterium]|nr:PHP domain-containing protein [Oscillospiraceae bacterium]
MKADLHCHTKLSDGSLGIEEIIQLAIKNGLDAIAITDHDCLAGNTRAKIIGERNGLKVIPGVEISATEKETGRTMHILAYKCDCPDRLEGLCHKNSTIRKRAGQYMMVKAAAKYNISADLVMKCASGSTNLYKQHIMHALMECGYTTEIYGELYNKLFLPDSPDSILVSPQYAPVEDVISMIHEAEGIAVLAHPALHGNIDLIERLIPMGLDGVEVWHPTATPEAEEQIMAVAKSAGLLMTGGSDFHGLYNRSKILPGDYVTPKKNFDELMNYKARKKRQQRKAEVAAAVSVE